MKLNIGAKILELRKARSITQEQLAAAVGVSIAAVSKWECAATYPDITLLPAIASYFEVSIDALIDYQVKPDKLQQYRDELLKYLQMSDYEGGLLFAEQAMKQFPNDFQILASTAQLKLNEGTSEACPDRKRAVETAIEYWNRALAVRPANAKVTKESILQNMSFAYNDIKDYDKAISILEEINVNGVFDPEIAHNLIEAGKVSEAKAKLQNYLFGKVFTFAMVTDSLGKCFRAEGELQYVVDLQHMHATFLAGFTNDTPNYCDLLCSSSYLDLAKLQKETGDEEGMWDSMEKSVYHAVRFDGQPSYAQSSVKFMNNREGWISNGSPGTACRGTLSRIQSNFSIFQADARYASILDKLEAAATDNRESGIW